MSEQERKKNEKESMICLTSKPSQKKFPKYLEFLYGLHQTQTLTPIDYAKWGVLEY